MKVLGADFVLYQVKDFDRAVKFYRDVLGLKAIEVHEEFCWAEFDVPPTTLALYSPVKNEGREPVPGSSTIALAVPDVAAAMEELKSKGVQLVYGPMDTPVCEMGGFLDPDGNLVSLHHRKDGTVG